MMRTRARWMACLVAGLSRDDILHYDVELVAIER
jgi:hypothetical protein